MQMPMGHIQTTLEMSVANIFQDQMYIKYQSIDNAKK
jgi:hypothetical protein